MCTVTRLRIDLPLVCSLRPTLIIDHPGRDAQAASNRRESATVETLGIGQQFQFCPDHAFLVVGVAGSDTSVKFHFHGEGERKLEIELGPQLSAQLHAFLGDALASMPQPPTPQPQMKDYLNLSVPGKGHSGANARTYFGDPYDKDILEAFGVLMIRANLVEVNLISLLASLSGMSEEQAASLFFSASSLKARCDMIKALVLPSLPLDEDEHLRSNILEGLDKVGAAASRRNSLVHGHWSFRGRHFEVTGFQPNRKNPHTTQTATAKSILEIAEAYRVVGLLIAASAETVLIRQAVLKRG